MTQKFIPEIGDTRRITFVDGSSEIITIASVATSKDCYPAYDVVDELGRLWIFPILPEKEN